MLKIGLNPPSAVARHAVMYGAGLEMGELFAARDCGGWACGPLYMLKCEGEGGGAIAGRDDVECGER